MFIGPRSKAMCCSGVAQVRSLGASFADGAGSSCSRTKVGTDSKGHSYSEQGMDYNCTRKMLDSPGDLGVGSCCKPGGCTQGPVGRHMIVGKCSEGYESEAVGWSSSSLVRGLGNWLTLTGSREG